MPLLWTGHEAGAAAMGVTAAWKRLAGWLLCGSRQHDDRDLLASLGAVSSVNGGETAGKNS